MKRDGGEKDRLPIFRIRLRELQGDRSNTEFAEFLGMSRQTIGFYLNGDRIPDALGLLQVSERCHVSADWLLGLSDIRVPNAEVRQICDYTGLAPESIETLHEISSEWRKPIAAIMLIDRMLEIGQARRYGQLAWRGAVAETQIKKVMIQEAEERGRDQNATLPWSEYVETEEHRKEMKEWKKQKEQFNEKFAAEASKPIGAVTATMEVRASDVAGLYKERALSEMKRAVEQAYRSYVEGMVKLGFGDEYDIYAEKYNFLPGARKKKMARENKPI